MEHATMAARPFPIAVAWLLVWFGLLALVVLAIAVASFDPLAPPVFEPGGRLPFTADTWANADPEKRGQMIRDLFRQHNELRGMSRTEIRELLGTPSKDAPALVWYAVTNSPPLSTLPPRHTLIIHFDGNNRVTAASVVYTGD
jgi:outer membrane protein assembly factor BamE (lipoprotein component of BamABCDE complex)